MTSRIVIGLSFALGAAIGTTFVDNLRAQGKGPAYVIVDFSEIKDMEALAKGGQTVSAAATALGGKTIARTDNPIALDGTPPKRFTVLAFDNVDKAKAWYASDAVKQARETRMKVSTSRSFIVEGLGN
jgi:uncharacterized protein (DUF1330 family)